MFTKARVEGVFLFTHLYNVFSRLQITLTTVIKRYAWRLGENFDDHSIELK